MHTLALPVLLLFAVLAALWASAGGSLLLAWLLAVLAIFVALAVLGQGVTGRWIGVLIDKRNVMSLSRFQILVWSLLLLSAYLAAALYNIFSGKPEPLVIAIQKELWLLMGISTTSLVGSPLILGGKSEKTADADELGRTLESLRQQGEADGAVDNRGHVVVNTSAAAARWSDMFTGEEVGNAAHIDVARVQMFFFTVVSAVAYAVMLGHMFATDLGKDIASLPTLDQSMVALIAISHGGYLTAKAVPHSQSGTPPAGG
jgi:hypothetical protein